MKLETGTLTKVLTPPPPNKIQFRYFFHFTMLPVTLGLSKSEQRLCNGLGVLVVKDKIPVWLCVLLQLYAFNGRTGQEIWHYDLEGTVRN